MQLSVLMFLQEFTRDLPFLRDIEAFRDTLQFRNFYGPDEISKKIEYQTTEIRSRN